MMSTDPLVDIKEQCLALLLGDLLLKGACGAVMIWPIIVDEVPFASVCEVPGFGFINWYCSKSEVLGDCISPISIGVG
jgi:hypothetical protein